MQFSTFIKSFKLRDCFFSVSPQGSGIDHRCLLHHGRASVLRAQAGVPQRHGVQEAQLIPRASGEALALYNISYLSSKLPNRPYGKWLDYRLFDFLFDI